MDSTLEEQPSERAPLFRGLPPEVLGERGGHPGEWAGPEGQREEHGPRPAGEQVLCYLDLQVAGGVGRGHGAVVSWAKPPRAPRSGRWLLPSSCVPLSSGPVPWHRETQPAPTLAHPNLPGCAREKGGTEGPVSPECPPSIFWLNIH